MKIFNLLKKFTSLEELPKFANKHGMVALVYDEVAASGVNPLDRKGLMRLTGYAQRQRDTWQVQKESIGTLARFCEKNGIGMLIFKGYALSLLYDVPTSRKPGDVDVWFFELGQRTNHPEGALSSNLSSLNSAKCAGEKVDELLKARGVNVLMTNEKHTVFDLKGAHYENHNYFLDSDEHDRLLEVEDYLINSLKGKGMERSEEWSNVYYPSPNFNAIYLPLHAAQHFMYSGASLKQLVDWPMFLKRCGKEVDWASVYALADKVGCRKWIDVLNSIAVNTFDVPLECVGLDNLEVRDEGLEEKVIKSFVYSEDVDSNSPFVKLFVQKTMKQLRNRWKSELIYGENFWVGYAKHVARYVRRKARGKVCG